MLLYNFDLCRFDSIVGRQSQNTKAAEWANSCRRSLALSIRVRSTTATQRDISLVEIPKYFQIWIIKSHCKCFCFILFSIFSGKQQIPFPSPPAKSHAWSTARWSWQLRQHQQLGRCMAVLIWGTGQLCHSSFRDLLGSGSEHHAIPKSAKAH